MAARSLRIIYYIALHYIVMVAVCKNTRHQYTLPPFCFLDFLVASVTVVPIEI